MGVRKRKKKDKLGNEETEPDGSDSSSHDFIDAVDKYKTFQIPNYHRLYPENGGNFEYIVFMESTENNKPLGDRDMMFFSNNLKRYNKGVKQLVRMNKYKVGVIFDSASMANAALANKKFLEWNKLKASIPAAATETTGVIQHVPTDLSNEQIYTALTSTKNIISIRRIMRRVKDDDNTFTLQATKTVCITFSCPSLPDSVDLNSWRFEVTPYVPPVKQCLRCLRYGHLAKFCKNSEKCSICAGSHNYKSCTVAPTSASCYHCKGNHIAISSECPVKQEKIKQCKEKVNKKSFADVVNEKSFPPLGIKNKNPTELFVSLLDSDHFLKLLVDSVVKLISMSKTNETSICTKNIKEFLIENIQQKQTPL